MYCTAFCGAVYIALETVLNGQYDLASPNGLPQCAIAFTTLYLAMEVISVIMELLNLDEEDKKYKTVSFIGQIGMVGMVSCSIWAMIEYCNSSTHMPSTMLTLTKKLNLPPEAICGIIAAVIGALILSTLGLLVLAHGEQEASGIVKQQFQECAPCI